MELEATAELFAQMPMPAPPPGADLYDVVEKFKFFGYFLSLALQPLIFQFRDHFTDGRTPWTGDQLVARPLPKHRTTKTENKHTYIPIIHALCGIQTHNPGFRASEDSTSSDRSATVTGMFGYSGRKEKPE
jgi:hypothetical protein